MSIIKVPGDDRVTYTDITETAFTQIYYCEDKNGTGPSSKFRAKYRKVSKYSLKILDPFSQSQFREMLNAKFCDFWFLGELTNHDSDPELNAEVKLLSQKVEPNPDYNPEYWQKEYESLAKAVARTEKETGTRAYFI